MDFENVYTTYNKMLVQMSKFLILYHTGLLYKIMHKILVFNPNDMIFGRLVPG